LRKSTRRALAALAALIAFGAIAGSASAKPFYYIVNQKSGKVLQAQGHSQAWGTKVVQENIGPYGAQHWFVKTEAGYAGLTVKSFENRNSHYCIHPSDWSGANGTHLGLASCSNASSTAARRWAITYTDGTNDANGIFFNKEFQMFNMQTFKYAGIAGAWPSPARRPAT
jgi:hypothetical protein